MKILAIETSCDDTGIAVLNVQRSVFNAVSNVVSSQTIHQNYGGVFPMMAKREHQRNLLPVLEKALQESKLSIPKSQFPIPNEKLKTIKKILEKEATLFESLKEFLETHQKPNVDMIAVTHGPGLEPCLWVGVNFARALSYYWNIPLIPVNHIEAHILVNFINHKSYIINPKEIFPAISLVVSGGHTQLILVEKIGNYKIIGETRDDAAGECFDKCAKILGLGYPGGPIISKIVTNANQNNSLIRTNKRIVLPRPMLNSKDYDFSFSGLKTAVLYKVKGAPQNSYVTPTRRWVGVDKEFVGQMCIEIQQAVIDVLIKKTLRAAKDFKAKTIILGGGVSANTELRKQFSKNLESGILKLELLVPPKELSTDNGLMIAVAGYFHRNKKAAWKNLAANANLRIDD